MQVGSFGEYPIGPPRGNYRSPCVERRWIVMLAGLVVAVILATALGSRQTTAGLGGSALPSRPAAAAGSSDPAGSIQPSVPAGSSSDLPSGSPTPGPSSAPSSPPSGASVSLAGLLALLPIEPERRDGYERSLFVLWIDADGDGCNTRREVLLRDAVIEPQVGPRCSLSGGRWVSPYDGLVVTDPAKLQIDHVIPLAEAWDSGASAWSPAERQAFANDLGVPFALLAVSATTNESKSDSDPADWLPPLAAERCPYLGDWLATKARWGLAVDQREHDAVLIDIAACQTTVMPYAPADWPPAGPTPTPAAGPSGAATGCDPAYPTVCIPPPPPDLDCGDVAYRNFVVLPPDPHHFDGDHDGIGCET
jgi:hypothetical protein